MKKTVFRLLLCAVIVFDAAAGPAPQLRFEVLGRERLLPEPAAGRLFVILARTNQPEPRLTLGRTGLDAPQALAQDIDQSSSLKPMVLDGNSFSFPATNLSLIPPGNYFVQALFDHNRDIRSPNAPGNLYSKVESLRIDPASATPIKLSLTEQVPPETLPPETELVKFVRLESRLLSRFHGRPVFLRAGIVLPEGYDASKEKRYPIWVRIGGLNTRYTTVERMMRPSSAFQKTWLADNTPRFILLQLDGAGPLGDPYYINSENSGPFGDALTRELIPLVESKFHGSSKRVLSGTSTGGWVSLALQIFHPDYFSGAWSSCPDPVDFRALQLINIYEDDNAFVNKSGLDRPSTRDLLGDITLTVRQEVGMENLLGRHNCYTGSGEQWGEWAAAFSPRGSDGVPVPIWDPLTGAINSKVAEQWKKHDLRLHLEKNWNELAPRLRGKLHIASGEADQYFLNNAVHLLDKFLAGAEPSIEAKIVYGPGKGHGWFDLSLAEMLKEMQTAVEK